MCLLTKVTILSFLQDKNRKVSVLHDEAVLQAQMPAQDGDLSYHTVTVANQKAFTSCTDENRVKSSHKVVEQYSPLSGA